MSTNEDEEKEFQEMYAKIKLCRAAIIEKHGKKRGLVDNMSCPTGCGGTLRYSIASLNGHIHAGCTTETCVRWME